MKKKSRGNILGGVILLLVPQLLMPVETGLAQTTKLNQGEPTYIEIGKDRLSLSDAMKLVMLRNLTLKNAAYDLLQTDTQLLKFQKKYAINLGLEGRFYYSQQPVFAELLRAIQGDTTTQYDIVGSIRKKFSTGTEIIGGINNVNYYDVNDQGFQNNPPNPAFYRHGFFLQIKQELLKNFLGRNDRATEEMLDTRTKITRSGLIDQLAGILVKTLSDYWSITIAKKSLDTRLTELAALKNVRRIIIKNTRIGLAEKFDINRYNALMALAENKVAKGRYDYQEAQRALIRQVDLPPETKITGVTELRKKLPQNLDLSKSIESAFSKRVDYKNALLELKAREIDREINSNKLLPSLLFDVKVQTASQGDSLDDSFAQAHSYEFPTVDVKLKMSYPLFDKETYVNARNTELQIRQQRIAILDLKKTLRDDVITKHDNVLLTHRIFVKSKIAQKESKAYYFGVLRRSKQGKFNSENVKNALDSMINAQLESLRSLVNYNIALLQYDISKNEIFERYDLNIKELLKKVKI